MRPTPPPLKLRHHWPSLFALLLALGILLLLRVELTRRHDEALHGRFRLETERITSKIVHRMGAYNQILKGTAGFFQATDRLDRQDWHTYLSRFDLENEYRGIQAVGLALHLPPQQLPPHVAAIRREGFPDYTVRPQGNRSEYSSIVYIEPFAGRNLRAFGFDMLTETKRRTAMHLARDTGTLRYTEKIVLVQETETAIQPGVLAYYPLYAKHTAPQNAEQRRQALVGWAYAAFRMGDLMSNVLNEDTTPLRIEIFDSEQPTPAALLFDNAAGTASPRAEPPLSRLSEIQHIPLEGRQWTVRYSALPAFLDQAKLQPLWIENSALVLIGLLLAGITWSRITHHRRAEEIARGLTRSLGRSEMRYRAIFSRARVSMLLTDPERGTILDANLAACRFYGHSPEQMKTLSYGDLAIDPAPQRAGRFHATHCLADGTQRDVEIHAGPLEIDGQHLLFLIVHDITERRKLEEDRQSLAQAVEQSPSSIVITNLDGAIEYVNAAFCATTGYTKEEALGQNPRILQSGETPPETYIELWNNITHGRLWAGLLHNKKKNGERYWEYAYIAPVMDGTGKILRYIAIKENVTEQRQREAEIRELNLRLQSILDAASEISIIATDRAGTITLFNRGAERLLGYRAEEIIGKTSPALIHLPDEVDARGQALSMELGRPISGFRVFVEKPELDGQEQRNWTYVRKDGRHITVSLVVTPVRATTGEMTGYLGVAQDITEQKQAESRLKESEERYRTVVENIREVIFQADSQGRWTFLNPAWEAMTGYRVAETLGRSYEDFIAPEDLASNQQLHEQFTREKREHVRYTVRFRRKDGVYRWLEVFAQLNPHKPTADTFGTLRDITEQHEAEIAILAAKEAAENANAAKSRFLATMSHEIRTPMNGVIGMTQLLMGSSLNAEQQEFAKTIQTSAQSLLTLINDLLDFSKIEAGRLDLERMIFQPGQVCQEVVDLFSLEAGHKGLVLQLELDPALPHWVSGDPGRLRQILTNLLSNALKFTLSGAIHMAVRAHPTAVPHTTAVEFSVQDTGIGMREEVLSGLFSPFYQGESSTTRRFGGTGLGLSITKRLVELMGGHIHVASTPGIGSTFTCRMDFEIAAPPQQEHLAAPLPALPVARILVVEDNATNQRVALHMLEKLGLTGNAVGNGEEAIDILRGIQYDLVLMDCQMPVMDGFTATRQIREGAAGKSNSRLPIIAMTANVQEEDRQRCLEVGMDDFIAKPIGLDILAATLARWLPQAPTATQPPHAEPQKMASVPPDTAAVFDAHAFLSVLGQDRKLAKAVAESLQADIPDYLSALDADLGAGRRSEAQRQIHTLKGLAAQAGGKALHAIAKELDQQMKAGEPPSADRIADLKWAANGLLEGLSAWARD